MSEQQSVGGGHADLEQGGDFVLQPDGEERPNLEGSAHLGRQPDSELSLEELEAEIAEAEALVQDLNQRLKQTADHNR